MKKSSFVILIPLCLLFPFALVGCSNVDIFPSSSVNSIEFVAPESVSDWPENRFTQELPAPTYGKIDSIYDYSDSGRYEIIMKDISSEESSSYVESLVELGYSEIISEGTDVSTGILLQKDSLVLSIAYSEECLNILISDLNLL